MSEHTVYLTPDGLKKLEQELEYLRTVRRQEVAKRLRAALEEEDILENAEYDDAKNEQAFVEGRILTLETMLTNAVIIEEREAAEDVRVGSRVTIIEDGSDTSETYRLVGSAEADPTQGQISNESPLGRALLGHRVGDDVFVDAPDGVLHFRIVAIE
ncbi:MAG: transcription elongation factor GreA [Anaerolineae bacterium]|jgi:transcription elongation factor GreA|nr:transcription elongation factor GreA [Anaerolineae bacterium]MDH7472952.1 transcription elongation factor GreA [Anaerolineae bacterium]